MKIMLIMCILEEQETYLLRAVSNHSVSCGSVVPCVETSPLEANNRGELFGSQWTSGHIRISKKGLDKLKGQIEGTDRRKDKRKPVQTNLRIYYMISFFPVLVGLQHKPLSGADTVGSLPKLNLKLKYVIINIIGDYKGSLINLNWRK